MRAILFGLGLLCLFFNGLSQQVPKSLTAANGTYIGFYEFRPYDYNANPTRKYPMIIFLQGVGGQGNGTSELHLELEAGLPRYIAEGATMTFTVNGKQESFIVLSPQLDRKYGSWQNFYVDEMLNYARQNLRVDEDRVYLTGLSLGGGGTWKYASASKANAQQFAAIAPICGTCDWNLPGLSSSINGAQTAVWAFHGIDDPVVDVNCTNIAIDVLRKDKPSKDVKRTIYSSGGHGVWDNAYSPSNVSEDGDDEENDDDDKAQNLFEWFLKNPRTGNGGNPGNTPPVANAGSDVKIVLPVSSTVLNATSSYDPDGHINSFSWNKIAGPAASISNTSSGSPTVSGLTQGTYIFRLTVTDNKGATAADEVTVVVDPAPVSNMLPTANAGADMRIRLPISIITLNGTSSIDPDGTIAGFSWTKISGPSATILNGLSGLTSAIGLVQGTYVFRLVVTDNKGATDEDDVTVIVDPLASSNLSPVAKAGNDAVLTLPTDNVILNGTSSFDPDGTVHDFAWSKISGPNNYSIDNSLSGYTTIRGLTQGSYVIRLTVTDNAGATGTDDITITVNASGLVETNKAPVAIVGNNISVTLPVSTIVLNGTSSFDPDGTIYDFGWTRISGPNNYVIENSRSGYTYISGVVAGVYVVRLTVTDNDGTTGFKDLTVTVNPGSGQGSNLSPVAIAGNDIRITLPVTTVTLNGTSSYDPDGTVHFFSWTKISGPSSYGINNAVSGYTQAINLTPGTYVFRLVVTDNNGATGSDEISIIVSAAGAGVTLGEVPGINSSAVAKPEAGTSAAIKLDIYPNPVLEGMNLNWSSSYRGNAQIRIVDILGRPVKLINVIKDRQLFSNRLSLPFLGKGVYYVEIRAKNETPVIRKFTKQ